jgi:PAS domain S-box-containing protein
VFVIQTEVYRRVFDSAPDAIVVVDGSGTIDLANPAAERLFGYAPAEMVGLPVEALVPDAVRGRHTRLREGFADRPSARPMGPTARLVAQHRDGQQIPVEIMLSPMRLDERLVTIAIVRDVTAAREAADALRESERHSQTLAAEVMDLYDRAPCGYHSLDAQGCFLRVNQTEADWLGYPREALLGRPYTDFVTPASRELFKASFPRFKAEGRIDGLEFEMIRADGSTFDVLLNATAIVDASGAFVSSRSTLFDITTRKAAEVQAASMSRELEAFSYSVAHDLRSPLRSIDGFSQALAEDYGGVLDDTGQDYLQRVRAAAQRMGRLIDDLLALSRITRADLRRERVDLSKLTREILERLRAEHPERTIEVTVAAELVVGADQRLLSVAMENLLSNAVKFTARRPVAHIEVGVRPGAETVYYVKDDGAGFDMAYADHLFKPFKRLHKQSEFEGTGIGLATVRRVIERHGGRIWADGAVDQGATFYFTL